MADPRIFNRGGTVNEKVLDQAIKRLFRTIQFAKGEANGVRTILRRDLYPKLIERIAGRLAGIPERGYELGAESGTLLEDVLKEVDAIIKKEIRLAAKSAKSSMIKFAKDESDWLMRSMSGAAPVELGLSPPSAQVLKSAATSRPFQGRLMKDWYGDLAADTQKRVRGAIREGMSNGETIDQMVRRLRGTRAGGFKDGVMEIATHQAEAIARTATIHVSAHAREATYGANESLIKAVMWVSTLDSTTCVVCGDLDGQEYPVGSGERPGAHWNCRCTTIPVLKSWKELGIDAGDMSPGQRASFDGLVPGDVKYGDWLKAQDKEFQIEALGPGKAKLFADGMSIGDFSTSTLKPISLKQLQASS